MLPKELQFTYADYIDFPEDGKRYEILEGRLLMVPSPFVPHQRISFNLSLYLGAYVKEKKIGEILCAPCDVVLSEINVVQPDIVFVSKKNSGIVAEDNIKGAPDLLIEIISNSSKKNDEATKKRIYAQSNVLEYWIVYPESKEIKVYIEPEKGYILWKSFSKEDLLFTPTFSDLKLNLKEVF